MEKIALRDAILNLFSDGLSLKEIHEHMVATLGDLAPSRSMVKKWIVESKRDRESLEDHPYQGRPMTVTTWDM